MNGASADPSPGSEQPCAPSARLTAALPVNRYGGSFDDADRLAAFLRTCGFSVSAAAAKAQLFARCAAALQAQDSAPLENGLAYFVPGRIEVLGKHTDYAGGSSLVADGDGTGCQHAFQHLPQLGRGEVQLLDETAVPKVESHRDSFSIRSWFGFCHVNYTATRASRRYSVYAGSSQF